MEFLYCILCNIEQDFNFPVYWLFECTCCIFFFYSIQFYWHYTSNLQNMVKIHLLHVQMWLFYYWMKLINLSISIWKKIMKAWTIETVWQSSSVYTRNSDNGKLENVLKCRIFGWIPGNLRLSSKQQIYMYKKKLYLLPFMAIINHRRLLHLKDIYLGLVNLKGAGQTQNKMFYVCLN